MRLAPSFSSTPAKSRLLRRLRNRHLVWENYSTTSLSQRRGAVRLESDVVFVSSLPRRNRRRILMTMTNATATLLPMQAMTMMPRCCWSSILRTARGALLSLPCTDAEIPRGVVMGSLSGNVFPLRFATLVTTLTGYRKRISPSIVVYIHWCVCLVVRSPLSSHVF